MGDPDIRVRRAVAGALVQLGHEKGETLLDIAERVPAAVMIAVAKSSKPAKKSSSGGGMNLDPGMLLKAGVGLLAVLLIGGGIWWWMNAPSSPPSKKKSAKSTATKKAPTAKKTTSKARPSAE
jgi:cytoskeletal protein RodZ